jgi:phenylacetate-coenzyme A ligase PaaK-like adenylate-forming protein
MNLNDISRKIFDIQSEIEFENIALHIFKFQYHHCAVYKKFCDLLKVSVDKICKIEDIPFLPIQFFKTHQIKSAEFLEEKIFTSSGTTGILTSKHFIKELNLYETSFLKTFESFYPDWEKSTIVGLLPSYLERSGSSLIYMVNYFIKHSKSDRSKFQLELTPEFLDFLVFDESPKIMFGVTFALLDLAKKGIKPRNTIIIETGGMKGRGKEITRQQLHETLKYSLSLKEIHSEYGMTELMSQSYLQEDYFSSPIWKKALVRETTDPLHVKTEGKGALNFIDLANIHSCSFIATDDLGIVFNGKFQVVGRIDHSETRGCNLLIL